MKELKGMNIHSLVMIQIKLENLTLNDTGKDSDFRKRGREREFPVGSVSLHFLLFLSP